LAIITKTNPAIRVKNQMQFNKDMFKLKLLEFGSDFPKKMGNYYAMKGFFGVGLGEGRE
jgi:hypothetical protein